MARRKKKNVVKINSGDDNVEVVQEKVDSLQIENGITNEELEAIDEEDIPTDISVKTIESIYQKAIKIQKELENRKIEYGRKNSSLDDEIKKLSDEKNEYETKKVDLEQSIKKYDDELREINKLRVGDFTNIIDKKVIDKYSESLDEQKELILAEIDKLKEVQTKYLESIVSKEREMFTSREELKTKRLDLGKEFQAKFEEKEIELEVLEKKLKRLEQELKYERDDFEDEKKYIEDKIRKRVENEISELKEKIKLLEEKNERLSREIETFKELERSFDGRDPQKIMDELNAAKDEIYDLKGKLELNPDSLKIDEFKKLKRDKQQWESDLKEALAAKSAYKQRWEREQLSIGEKETLEFQKEELTKRIELQQIALDEFQEVLDKSNATTVFTSCIDMDEKYREHDNIEPENGFFSKDWIEIVQQKLASREIPLYYDGNVLRSFVSGLAMSRLNILQGISGTGKTSLAEAFAKAIGGHFETIEVQSGWKDRQDLIGYYNTFEKKFYESDFLKALYKANTPKYRNKPFFIILDEMNLSHPEHYFADLLSLMEKTTFEEQKLKICDKVNGKPDLMIDDVGTFKLQIPDNVWFIGTANHDETTLQFAPKTYDRANVMEMPKNPKHTSIALDPDFDSEYVIMDNENFLENFKVENYNFKTIEKYLSNTSNFKKLCNKLGIGWGNRLEKQIKNFVPVFIKLGGTESDAMDHILSSKILRNIQGRYDLSEVALNEMKEELEVNFADNFGDFPEKCISIIDDEIDKK